MPNNRIYDEPAAPADPITAQAIFERIESMRGKQTVILITHHIRAAMKADLVLCLKKGELIEQGVSAFQHHSTDTEAYRNLDARGATEAERWILSLARRRRDA